jgi:hypothetical protein
MKAELTYFYFTVNALPLSDHARLAIRHRLREGCNWEFKRVFDIN